MIIAGKELQEKVSKDLDRGWLYHKTKGQNYPKVLILFRKHRTFDHLGFLILAVIAPDVYISKTINKASIVH